MENLLESQGSRSMEPWFNGEQLDEMNALIRDYQKEMDSKVSYTKYMYINC